MGYTSPKSFFELLRNMKQLSSIIYKKADWAFFQSKFNNAWIKYHYKGNNSNTISNLKSLLDCNRSNQSILKEISPEYSLEGLVLKLKLQYFGTWWEELIHWKIPWGWERLKVGGEGDNRGWDGWMASSTQ